MEYVNIAQVTQYHHRISKNVSNPYAIQGQQSLKMELAKNALHIPFLLLTKEIVFSQGASNMRNFFRMDLVGNVV